MPQTLQYEKGPLDCGCCHFALWRHKSGSLAAGQLHYPISLLLYYTVLSNDGCG